MKAIDIFCWIVIGGAILFVFGFFLWAIYSIAKLSDERSEKYWESQIVNQEDEEEDVIEPL